MSFMTAALVFSSTWFAYPHVDDGELAGADEFHAGRYVSDDIPAEFLSDTPERLGLWFHVGERLIYRISWGPFTVGTTTIASEWVEYEGSEMIEISVVTRSTPFFSRIYRVDDRLASIVEPTSFMPVRFTKRLSEGRHRVHEVTTFDHEAGTAEWTNLLDGESKELELERDTRCLLSFMFYMRLQKIEPDKEYRFRLMADENIHDLDVISRSYEMQEIPRFGEVRTLLLEPDAPFHGLFVRVGNIRVWVSDDDRFLCVRATAGFALGTIVVVLAGVEGPGDDFWSYASGGRR